MRLDHPFDDLCDELNKLCRARGLHGYFYLNQMGGGTMGVVADIFESSDESESAYILLTGDGTLPDSTDGPWTACIHHWTNGDCNERVIGQNLTRREMLVLAVAMLEASK